MRHEPMDNYIEAYQGNDMAGYIMQTGFSLPKDSGAICSITNVRDTAIIITDNYVWRAKPDHYSGFCMERLTHL